MSAELILAGLSKVRKMGPDRWMACCPAHDDKSPSLSIRETSDGRVLLHCWTGCGANEVLDALGLDFDALFPERLIDHAPRERQPFSHREAMAGLVPEVMMIAAASSDMLKSPLNKRDHDRLVIAASRLAAAASYVEGL